MSTAPDGRTWLEHCAEFHEESARWLSTCMEALDANAIFTPDWKQRITKHQAFAIACREAAGTNQTKT